MTVNEQWRAFLQGFIMGAASHIPGAWIDHRGSNTIEGHFVIATADRQRFKVTVEEIDTPADQTPPTMVR